MFATTPHEPRPDLGSGRDRDLDLNRVSLVPLERVQTGRYTFLRPINTERYSTDEEMRRAALKTRSVLAAAFVNGSLEAQTVWAEGERFLLIGQSSCLLSAEADFAALVAPVLGEHPEAKGIVPISEYDSGWRAQFGWIALAAPEESDHYAVYSYMRPSILWFEERPESLQSIVEQRSLQKRGLRSMEDIFREALQPSHP